MLRDRVSTLVEFMLVRLSLFAERDRQTEKQFESSIWKTESRVSTIITEDTRFGLKFLALFIRVHVSSTHQTECQVSTSIQCHWWINTRVWLSLFHDTRAWLTMTSLLSLNVKSCKCRKSVQSFNLEVFVKTSTCTDSHRCVRTLLQKQNSRFFTNLYAVFHRFVGRVVLKFMCFFYDTEGGTRWRKKKNRSVVPPTLKGFVFDFFFYTNIPVYEMWIYIHRHMCYVYIYTYICMYMCMSMYHTVCVWMI